MVRLQTAAALGGSVLVVDDQPEFCTAVRGLLELNGYKVFTAETSSAALEMLTHTPVDVVLLDYFLEGAVTGKEVIEKLRAMPGPNRHAKIVLVTGYAGDVPPIETFVALDIAGYIAKGETSQQILLWTLAGLRFARDERRLRAMTEGMRYILDAVGVLHRMQPLDSLLQAVLTLLAGLLDVTHSFLATEAGRTTADVVDSFLAITDEQTTDLAVRAGTGRYSRFNVRISELLDVAEMALVAAALRSGEVQIGAEATVVPLVAGTATVGVVYLSRTVVPDELEQFGELLRLFASQATVALNNARLYQQITLDPLTRALAGENLRRWLPGEIFQAWNSEQPLAALYVNVRHMRAINAEGGNQAGDQALKVVAGVLRQCTRSAKEALLGTDVTGRLEGDRFVVILPRTDLEGARLVLNRIRQALANQPVQLSGGAPRVLEIEAGICALGRTPDRQAAAGRAPVPDEYWHNLAVTLLARAAEACQLPENAIGLEWPSLPS